MRQRLGGFGPLLEMIQDSLDHRRVFDASDGLDGAAAAVAGFDVDPEHASSSKADVEAFAP